MTKSNVVEKELNIIINENVFKRWDYILFFLLTCMTSISIWYFISYWFSLKDWMNYPVIFSTMTVILIVILSNKQGEWWLLLWMKRPRPMHTQTDWKVGVVTTFVPGAEPLEMLEETVRALIALEYPHDTWVLDEGDDNNVKVLCEELGAYHFSRKHLPQYQAEDGPFQSHSKHGNYNAWLYDIGFERYDIITAFDPDHVPVPAFLTHVLGYFEAPQVAYVQAAPAYYNQKASFIARGAAEETYGYHSSIQMASYNMGYPIIIGSHNTHRVTALMQMGGFAPHPADDLLLTLLYQSHNWRGVYVPYILAKGLAPVDWNGYLTQQRRWARSVLDVKFRLYPQICKKISLKTRAMSFLHTLKYMHKSIIIPICLILLTYMLATGNIPQVISYPIIPKLAILYGALKICEFYRQRFYLDWRTEWGLHWRAGLLQFAKWPYVLIALHEVIFKYPMPYDLTTKFKTKSHMTLLWPHLFVGCCIGAAWTIGVVSGRMTNPLLHICAAVLVMISFAFVLSEHMKVPDPYDRNLAHDR